jgi:TatD DNase family protein
VNTILALADSHAHLDMAEFDADRSEVVKRAWTAGVRNILCPAEMTSATSLATVLALGQEHPWIAWAAGVHPHQAKELAPGHLDKIRELKRDVQIRAVGEIGLDFHYNFSPAAAQREAFRAQLRLAQELLLPVIIHSRNAGPEMIAAVTEEGFTRGGVLHCFTEHWDTAREMLDRGFFISFSGILTYANAQSLRDVAREIPLDRLLVETDSPFLVPAPRRGKEKRNEPAFIVETARVLAELKSITLEDIAAATRQNFQSLFKIS